MKVSVCLSLVPDHTADPIRNDFFQHGFIQPAGSSLIIGRISAVLSRHHRLHLCNEPGLLFSGQGILHTLEGKLTVQLIGTVVHRILSEILQEGCHVQPFHRLLKLRNPDFSFRPFQVFRIHPGAGRRSAPVASDDAHRDIQRFLQILRKIIPNRRKPAQILRGASTPEALIDIRKILQLPLITDLRIIKEPDIRIHLSGNHLFKMLFKAQKIFHIALSACQPHLSDADIAEGCRTLHSGDRKGQPSRRAHFRQKCSPVSLRISPGLCGMISQSNPDRLARFACAPDRNLFLSLQDHMIRKNHGWFHMLVSPLFRLYHSAVPASDSCLFCSFKYHYTIDHPQQKSPGYESRGQVPRLTHDSRNLAPCPTFL